MSDYKQIDLFGEVIVQKELTPPKPRRKIKTMQEAHGEKPNHICKNCKHLITRRYSDTYHKCALWSSTTSPSTDIKTTQTACGLFEPWENATERHRRLSVFGLVGN